MRESNTQPSQPCGSVLPQPQPGTDDAEPLLGRLALWDGWLTGLAAEGGEAPDLHVGPVLLRRGGRARTGLAVLSLACPPFDDAPGLVVEHDGAETSLAALAGRQEALAADRNLTVLVYPMSRQALGRLAAVRHLSLRLAGTGLTLDGAAGAELQRRCRALSATGRLPPRAAQAV